MFGKLHQLSINTSTNTVKVFFFHRLFSLMYFKQSLREVSLLMGSRSNVEDMDFGVGRTQLSLSRLIFFISTGDDSSRTVMGRVLRAFVCINPILLLQKNIQKLVIYEVKMFAKFPILVAAGLHFFKVSLAVSHHRGRKKRTNHRMKGGKVQAGFFNSGLFSREPAHLHLRTTLISVKGKAFRDLIISSQALTLKGSVTSQHCHTQTKLLKDEPLGKMAHSCPNHLVLSAGELLLISIS